MIKWDHSHDFSVPTFTSGSYETVKINLQDEKFKYIKGHAIDGKILVPGTAYLMFVWEAFIEQNNGDPEDPVEFNDVRFLRATNINEDTSVNLKVHVHIGTGIFEVGI